MTGCEGMTIRTMYGEEDLAENGAFQGGWINFGYYADIPLDQLSEEKRIQSASALYDLIFSELFVSRRDVVLEVGAGRGGGCIQLLDTCHPQSVTGLDITPEQVARAIEIHQSKMGEGRVFFVEGAAEKLPFENERFTRLYSVEAAQHFESIPAFAREANRVLQKAGKMAVTTFFSQSENVLPELKQLFSTIENGIDRVMPVESFVEELKEAGFGISKCHSIGKNVFPGFDRWAELAGSDSWARNFLRAYKEGLLDYYYVTATKI